MSTLHVDALVASSNKSKARSGKHAPLEMLTLLQVYLNPERELSDMPLKSFYRYVLPEPSLAGECSWFYSSLGMQH